MTIIVCDKCGSKINSNPMSSIQLPMFTIRKLVGVPSFWVDVNLCPECCKKLEGWLNGQKV